MKRAIYIIIFFLFSSVESESHKFDQELKNSVENLSRSKKNVARDKYRNPIETLSFFEIEKNKKVLEISSNEINMHKEFLKKDLKKNYY